ncbi:hypothetical protein D3C72_2463870 [compost metagenome]
MGAVIGVLLGGIELVFLALGIRVAVDIAGVQFLDGIVAEEVHRSGEAVQRLLRGEARGER